MAAPALREIHNFDDLLVYLEEKLDWPLQGYSLEDAAYTYEPAELGLKDEDAARIKAIHQLRPLTHGQPWGIFFVEFENKKLPVVVLRRILSHLVIKKRTTASKAAAPAWYAEDLLFVTAFGEDGTDNREIAFAHFHQNPGDLPTLHVLGWDGGDTPLKLAQIDQTLRERLHWPEDEGNAAAWRETWRKPFKHKIGHVIRTADLLAEELARLARGIRDKAKRMLAAESERGALTKLFKAFQSALIHDLTPESFADTYAQTITYGLLTAAISRTEMSEGRHGTALSADNLTDMVPVTNPFLKEMLQTFLKVGGRKGGIDFDELGIQDVVELLRGNETDLPAILRDFGNKTRGEDPVIHFYEHFLHAYNKKLKVQRGVFYTPQPVVCYIVRSVHELLQTEFGLADGLADTTTWGEMLQKHPELKLPMLTDDVGREYPLSTDEPFVQILDPATGTATFLVEVIDVIHRTLAAKWKQQRLTEDQQRAAWNDYVPQHLLPRLHAFELMMAPYAIAHMKIGLKLAETGYRFGTEERARIYLTNALEPWVKQLPLIGFDALAHEAAAVNEIKRHKRFTVVIGNPPYSSLSQNMGDWIKKLVSPFRLIDGVPIHEKGKRNHLQDDYVKFVRLALLQIETSHVGVCGMITNHGYLYSPTFRGMRFYLKSKVSGGRFLDLNGNAKRDDALRHPGDENVFDIQQGVAIGLFWVTENGSGTAHIEHSSVFGSRSYKYTLLGNSAENAVRFSTIHPEPEFYLFEAPDIVKPKEYDSWWKLDEVMPFGGTGIKTNRDGFVIDFEDAPLIERMNLFRDESVSDGAVEKRLGLKENYTWKIPKQRQLFRKDKAHDRIKDVAYRPFDQRRIYYQRHVVYNPRFDTMAQARKGNVFLLSCRQQFETGFRHALVTRQMFECCLVSAKSREITSGFPLYVFHDAGDDSSFLLPSLGEGQRRPNLSKTFLQAIENNLGLLIVTDECGGTRPTMSVNGETVLAYIYAVLHSPCYRDRYAENLKIDFPRLPLTGDLELFRALANLGGELVALHLLESPKVNDFITRFEGQGDNGIPKKPTYKDGAVWINSIQRFEGVPEAVWNFHIGGYQVCEKWLKDRKGRILSAEDIAHYQRVVVALNETIRLMQEVDQVIGKHGGWPGAFQTADHSKTS